MGKLLQASFGWSSKLEISCSPFDGLVEENGKIYCLEMVLEIQTREVQYLLRPSGNTRPHMLFASLRVMSLVEKCSLGGFFNLCWQHLCHILFCSVM